MSNASISAAIQQLELIVDACIKQANPHGLFAALYLKVTRTIRDAIERREFQDNDRMERFDVIFAGRYIAAYEARAAGKPTTAAWQIAFDAAPNPDLLAIQHLLLGMNAHINLDLGIVAAQVSRGADLASLESDFNKINDILLQLLDSVQAEVNRISPMMWLIDSLFTQKDEQFAGFNMRMARLYAWKCAQLVHVLPEEQEAGEIDLLDQAAAAFGHQFVRPRWLLSKLIGWTRFMENRDVAGQIRRLREL